MSVLDPVSLARRAVKTATTAGGIAANPLAAVPLIGLGKASEYGGQFIGEKAAAGATELLRQGGRRAAQGVKDELDPWVEQKKAEAKGGLVLAALGAVGVAGLVYAMSRK